MNEKLSDSLLDNIPEFSVSEISIAIKRVLEGNFSRIRVRGEITELKRYPSGHVYFSLKDEEGKLTAIIWRYMASRLKIPLENGTEIIATGKISAYGERSSYQLIVEQVDYAGEGALLARIERLRKKLEAEGLFSSENKHALPILPQVIGVITSSQGAVLHDIRTTIQRRFPRNLLIWPVAVQGEGAAEQISKAIEGFNQLPLDGEIPRPDILIVARGGGSLEDLMAFNEENVVRAAASSHIPLISAVGHETDTTLIDFVSDRRAPTPTAAAELAVPSLVELSSAISQITTRLNKALDYKFQSVRMHLGQLLAGLPDISTLLVQTRMKLDERAYRLQLALPALVMRRRIALGNINLVDHYITNRIERQKASLALSVAQMRAAWQYHLQNQRMIFPVLSIGNLQALYREKRIHFDGVRARLEGLSPYAILARGYVFVKDKQGHPVTTTRNLRIGTDLKLIFHDGERDVRVLRKQDSKQESFDL